MTDLHLLGLLSIIAGILLSVWAWNKLNSHDDDDEPEMGVGA